MGEVISFLEKAVEIFQSAVNSLPPEAMGAGSAEGQRTYETFHQFDEDGSDKIEFEEFRAVMAHLNISVSRDKALEMFANADADKDMSLDFTEFEAVMANLNEEVAENALA